MRRLEIKKLEKILQKARAYSLMSIYFAGSGHPGGVLSCINIVIYLFSKQLNLKKLNQFKNINRDRVILSKGHSVPAIYSTLAAMNLIHYRDILQLRKISSIYQGHPCRINTPWIEASTGSLGQGFSFAIGQALTLKYLRNKNRVYTIIGDGEMQEGQIWEGVMFSAQKKLDNLIAILDYNKLQSDNFNKNIINIEPLKDKLTAFNWNVIEINGHSFHDINKAIKKKYNNRKPLFIIAHTVKGKGISFMENKPLWHGSVKMNFEQIKSSLIELGVKQNLIEECLNNE